MAKHVCYQDMGNILYIKIALAVIYLRNIYIWNCSKPVEWVWSI